MRLDADDDVEIADCAAAQASVAFACNANALPVAGSSFDANLQRIDAFDAAFAVAYRTSRNILTGAMAAGTRDVELHASTGLLDGALAVTLRAFAGSLDKS